MKTCTICNQTKELSEFYSHPHTKDGRGSRCKVCETIYKYEARRKKKQLLVEYLGGKCVRCGYNKNIAALDFHHINGKDFAISEKDYSFEKMKKEVSKCELLCANCHREEHTK